MATKIPIPTKKKLRMVAAMNNTSAADIMYRAITAYVDAALKNEPILKSLEAGK